MLASNLAIQQQQQRGDSLWNGAILGGLVGAGAGYGAQEAIVGGHYNKAVSGYKMGNLMDQNDAHYANQKEGVKLTEMQQKNNAAFEKRQRADYEQLERGHEKRKKFSARAGEQFGGSRNMQRGVYSIGGAALGAAIGGLTDSLL